MKRALLIIAHGSRNKPANDEVRELAHVVAERVRDSFAICEAAFLELAEPDIPSGVRICARFGAEQICALPYFLNTGMHVSQDVPQLLRRAGEDFPDIEINILPHIGSIDEMPDFIVKLVNR